MLPYKLNLKMIEEVWYLNFLIHFWLKKGSTDNVMSDVRDSTSRQKATVVWRDVVNRGWPHNFQDGRLHKRTLPLDGTQLESG